MKKKILGLLLAGIMIASTLTGCGQDSITGAKSTSYMTRINAKTDENVIDDKYRTTYEIFVGSFYDSDGDGTGDLKGVIDKMDYIKSLGVNEIWLMPICPSPTYHKYDVSDYEAIDEAYGTMDDFTELVDLCHQNGIHLITDLVLNHTSIEHPWFMQAAEYLKGLSADEKPSEKDCPYYGYYNFSKEPKDGYNLLKGSSWYYESQFWEGMPDLNLDNSAVRAEIKQITDFWLDKGVDGFRLDAVTSYYTGQTEKNIEFLKWLNDEIKEKKSDAYIVGECWSNYVNYTSYYASGVDSFFDFDFADNTGFIAQTVRGTMTASKFGTMMTKVQDSILESNPDGIDAPFYTNHDMARSAGYYTDDTDFSVKFAEGLNLMMSGNAFIYYGEEIGMKGSGKDENKRAPMYWSSDADAKGMTDGPAAMDKVEMEYEPEDVQATDSSSILSYIKEAVRLRNNFPSIARGRISVIDKATSDTILAVEKKTDGDKYDPVVIVYNMSTDSQTIKQKDLGGYNTLSGVLVTDDTEISVKDGTITMPGHSIAVFTN